MQSLPERFRAKFRVEDGGCWTWTAGRLKGGYGRYSVGAKTCLAHRVAYELLCGPIPDGLQIDHLCRNRACVNPAHLEPVTALENGLRGQGPSAENSRKTHCARGHEFTPENTYRKLNKGRPGRQCRRCVFEDTAARRARLHAQGLSTKGRAYRYAAYLSE